MAPPVRAGPAESAGWIRSQEREAAFGTTAAHWYGPDLGASRADRVREHASRRPDNQPKPRVLTCTCVRPGRVMFLPVAKPVVGLVAFFSFVGNWNNFFLPYLVRPTASSSRSRSA
ncbi:hypothetical protein OG776_02475 [Streptomyces sp. NBC_01689]